MHVYKDARNKMSFVRIVVKMFVYGLILFVTMRSVNCAFFDLTDIDDPLSLLWHTKESIVTNSKSCIVDGTTTSGVCKHKTHCFLSGGQSHGHSGCGILSTCCTYPTGTCLKKTAAKTDYFIGENLNTPIDCEYIIEIRNDNVCQVRVDFEIFRLSPSVEKTPVAGDAFRQTICQTDYMEINPSTYNIPIFCDYNDGQHVYVHLDKHRQVRLSIHLGNRTSNSAAILSPRWKIKTTQLECPGIKKFFDKHHSDSISDFNLLAPPGAIQYFINSTGRIRSFGFDGSRGEYISGLRYGIAFKRTPFFSCIKFTTNYVELRRGAPHPIIAEPNYCLDYLFIPELKTSDVKYDIISKYCPIINPVTDETLYSYPPGPFYIHFVSALKYDQHDHIPVHAFDIQYDLLFIC